MLNNPINRYGNPNATGGYFGGKSHSHPRLVKQRQLKSQINCHVHKFGIQSKRKTEKKRKSGRPAKLNEKKGDRDLEREIKNKGDIFLLEEQHENFVAAVTK